jgi:hypothetical protein
MGIALFFIALAGAFLQTNIGFGFPVLAMVFLPALPWFRSVVGQKTNVSPFRDYFFCTFLTTFE